MTRALSLMPTFPFPNETIETGIRGDYANLTAIVDLTLSRLDSAFFTGTRWKATSPSWNCSGAAPSASCPARTPQGNPLTVPYRFDQGP